LGPIPIKSGEVRPGPIKTAGENEVTFVSDDKYKAALAGSSAVAVIVPECIEGLDKPQLVVKNINAALIEVRIFLRLN